MSSYLSKSKKDFKPKAPARRPGATAHHNAVRGSIERQTQSQTPQPPSVRQSTTPAPSLIHERSASADRRHSTNASQKLQEPEVNAIPQSTRTDLDTSRPGHTSPITQPTQDTTHLVANESLRNEPRLSEGLPSGARNRNEQMEKEVQTHQLIEHTYNGGVSISIPVRREALGSPTEAQIAVQESERITIPDESLQLLLQATAVEATNAADATYGSHYQNESDQSHLVERQSKRRRLNASYVEHSSNATENSASGSSASLSRSIEASEGQVHPSGSDARAKSKTKSTSASSKSKKKASDLADEIVEDAIQGSQVTRRRAKKQGAGSGGRKRAETPQENEDIEILPDKVAMADLTKDSRFGKVSERQRRLKKKDDEERVRKEEESKRLEQDEASVQSELQNPQNSSHQIGTVQSSSNPPNPDRSRGSNSATQQEPAVIQRVLENNASANTFAPRLRIVHGQIVQDEDAMRFDRHQDAQGGGMERVTIEDELSRKTNAGSYLKREKSVKWSADLTERFYDGLRMFGTDFEMISKMFPGLTRRQIKLKFVREEKKDKEYIKQVLIREQMPVDMEEFSKLSETQYRDPKELEREMDEDRKGLEEEQAAEKEALEESIRRRQAEADAEAAAVADDSSMDEAEKLRERRAGKRVKRNAKRSQQDSSIDVPKASLHGNDKVPTVVEQTA